MLPPQLEQMFGGDRGIGEERGGRPADLPTPTIVKNDAPGHRSP